MQVLIEKVSSSAEDVWMSNVEPQRLLRLANPIRQGGRINIVLVSGPLYDDQNQVLQFDLESAVLLNLGNTAVTYLINSREDEVSKSSSVSSVPPVHNEIIQSPGDLHYLQELRSLPELQKKVGEQLLAEVRKQFAGELIFHQKSGKYVESPDNFWVVRIQPRVQSLRIIVYGTPQKHGIQSSVKLSDDMAGYSNFIINSQHQIADAVNVIRQAKRLKDNNR